MANAECLSQKNPDQGCRGCTIMNDIQKDLKSLNGEREDAIAVRSIIFDRSKDCPEVMQPVIRNVVFSESGEK